MAYNNPSSWDSLRVDDRVFLDLLQNAANQPGSLQLDPNRFPAPPQDNPTPPASEDSSPSPPSIQEREEFANKHGRSGSLQLSHHNTRRSAAAALGNPDDDLKRKVDELSDSDDSSYEQPQSKHHHKDSAGPRRSSGGPSSNKKKGPGGADENRAQKRKEQNRAAQRAFRERKERHVRELEDQLAAMEAKANSQNRENENLRDLLGRLQNENLLLKQSAFTFSFPGTNNSSSSGGPSSSALSAQPSTQSRRASSPKLASPSSSSSASTPENTTAASPSASTIGAQSALFERPSLPSGSGNSSSSRLAPTASAGTSSGSSSASSPSTAPSTSRFLSSPSAFGLTNLPDFSSNSNTMLGNSNDFSFLGGGIDLSMFDNNAKKSGGFNTGGNGGLTTIAANPMYMSFGDPAMDPMAWASFGPGDYLAGGAAGSGTGAAGQSPASATAFGVNPFDTTSNGNGAGGLDINGMFGIPSSYGSSFGGAPSGGLPAYSVIGGPDDMFSGVGGATPSFLDFSNNGGAPNARNSPVSSSVVGSGSGGTFSDVGSSVNPADDKTGASTDGAATQTGEEHGEGCPKTVEDIKRMQAENSTPSTFGKPMSPNGGSASPHVLKSIPLASKMSASASSTSLSSASSVTSPVTPPQSSSIALQASSSTSSLPSTNVSSTNPNRLPNKDLEKDHACAHARMAALCADLPRTTKKPNQIEIGRAWEKIRQIPTFEDCDIDQLCSELSAKARCDGSRPVLEETSFNDIVQKLGSVYKR